MVHVYNIRKVVKVLGDREVLHSIDLDLQDGAVTSLVGPSGSGKSTLLRLLNRLMDCDEGCILYRGTDIREMDPLKLRREAVLIPQESHMFPGTVRDNISYAVRLHSLPEEDPRQYLEMVGLPSSFLEKDAEKLSGGERKRVALARVLPLAPKVLLLDEPTAGIDPRNVSLLEDHIREMNKQMGTTVIWVTHDVGQASRISDHIANLKDGCITGIAAREDFQWGNAF